MNKIGLAILPDWKQMMNNYHTPVLFKQVISSLNIQKNGKYIDCTLGGGSFTEEILKSGGNVLAIDCDIEAVNYSRKRLSSFLNTACPDSQSKLSVFQDKTGALCRNLLSKLIIVKDNFSNLDKIADKYNYINADGLIIDLGVSSSQLDQPKRGFSYNSNDLLDMRMDKELEVSAIDLINGLTEKELYELFKKFGEELYSWSIARAIIRTRKLKKIEYCKELADICRQVYKYKKGNSEKINPATRIFQALRIVVNDELHNLNIVLPKALNILKENGIMIILSYHSLEDRIVKKFFLDQEKINKMTLITNKPLQAENTEICMNHRSRSVKMRIGKKI